MATLYLKCQCCCIFLLFFFLKQACGQTSFTGKVINENNDSPIQNASIYFNNTTIDTQTNQQGEFKFDNINSLNTELVIFCYGYELIVFKPTAAQLAVKIFAGGICNKINIVLIADRTFCCFFSYADKIFIKNILVNCFYFYRKIFHFCSQYLFWM